MRVRFVVGLFLLLTLAAGTAAAQTPIQGSIKAGINFSTVSGPFGEGTSKSMRIGGVFGGGVSRMINDRVTMDIDVLYSMEGTKFKDPEGLGTNDSVTFGSDYVRIPLLLRIGAGSGARSSYVLLGPSLGFLVRAKAKVFEQTVDFKDTNNTFDLGIVFGAGTTVNTLFVEGRYTLGVSNVNKSTVDFDADEEAANRNQTVSILIGKRF